MTSHVEVSLGTGRAVATVRLNRPARGNSLTPEVCSELADTIESLPASTVCIVLASQGPIFCAGADLAFLEEIVSKRDENYIRSAVYGGFQRLICALSFAPAITVARVQGAAVGAGADLALACDIKVASSLAFLQETWIKLGLISALGGTYSLPISLGTGDGLLALLTAERITAERAKQGGLFQRVVESDALDREVDQVVQSIASNDPEAVRAMKALVLESERAHREKVLAAALETQVNLLMSPRLAARVEALRRHTAGPTGDAR